MALPHGGAGCALAQVVAVGLDAILLSSTVLRTTCPRNLTALDKLNQVAILGFLFGAGLVVYRGFQVRREGLRGPWAGDSVCTVASGRDVHCYSSKGQCAHRHLGHCLADGSLASSTGCTHPRTTALSA